MGRYMDTQQTGVAVRVTKEKNKKDIPDSNATDVSEPKMESEI